MMHHIKIYYSDRFFLLVRNRVNEQLLHKEQSVIPKTYQYIFSHSGNLFSVSFYDLLTRLGYSTDELFRNNYDYENPFRAMFFFITESMALSNNERLNNMMLASLMHLLMYVAHGNEKAYSFLHELNLIFEDAKEKALSEETRLFQSIK